MSNDPVNRKVYANEGNSEVLKQLRKLGAESRVLDAGCGAGANARQLHAQGVVVDGVTLSEDEAAIAREFCRMVTVHNLEQGLPGDFLSQKYDYAVCSHVLEHICFPDKLLNDIRSCLKENGAIVVALPNLLFVKNRINICMGKFEYTKHGLMDNTHFRFYTFKTARKLLEDFGFKVETHYATGFLPLGPFRRTVPVIAKAIDEALVARWPGLFGNQLVLIGRK